jgi:malate dehydrogenase (oxaloacetate-decarboxylating)(NADP+)
MERVRGEAYDAFVDEFMVAVVDVFGHHCLIQHEDFANANAQRFLDKYRDRVLQFNDDVQGTAAVALAGIFSALRVKGVQSALRDHKFLFLGAGSAGIGIGSLIALELMRGGMSEEEAHRSCYFVDSKGLVYAGRDHISADKAPFAHEVSDELRAAAGSGFEAIVKALKPTGIVGVSTIYGAFTPGVLKAMAAANERPIVFALSNPLTKCECSAEEAYVETNGRAIFASGSPFDPLTLADGSRRVPGQGNNAYIFPGLGMGTVVSKARHITDDMLLASAKALASLVTEESLDVGTMYPPISDLLQVSTHIALAVANEAAASGECDVTGLTLQSIRDSLYEPACARSALA